VCEEVISRDIDQNDGLLERVKDAFPGLVSQSGGDGNSALMVRIYKSKKLNYKKWRLISRREHGYLSVSCQC